MPTSVLRSWGHLEHHLRSACLFQRLLLVLHGSRRGVWQFDVCHSGIRLIADTRHALLNKSCPMADSNGPEGYKHLWNHIFENDDEYRIWKGDVCGRCDGWNLAIRASFDAGNYHRGHAWHKHIAHSRFRRSGARLPTADVKQSDRLAGFRKLHKYMADHGVSASA